MDIEQPEELAAYLEHTGRIVKGEAVTARILHGGVSNRTVLVTRPSGDAWVIKQALERLRVATEWLSSPERIHREAAGLRFLREILPEGSIPPFVFEDRKHHLLAMAAVPQPHANWKEVLLRGEVEDEHVQQFGSMLGTIHRRSHDRRADVAASFGDRSFFEGLRLEPYYLYAARQVPSAAPFLNGLVEETRQTQLCLVHGDYSPKNILIHNGALVLLDHEVVHFGDPAFDVGFSMAHLLSKAHHLVTHRERFGEAAKLHWRTYREALGDVAWGNAVEPRAVRHSLGCLLARVAGRSTLEYLTPQERSKQAVAVLQVISEPPAGISELADAFLDRLSSSP